MRSLFSPIGHTTQLSTTTLLTGEAFTEVPPPAAAAAAENIV